MLAINNRGGAKTYHNGRCKSATGFEIQAWGVSSVIGELRPELRTSAPPFLRKLAWPSCSP